MLKQDPALGIPGEQGDATTSAVAWSAIIAGAFTATAISLILLLLGSGFGLASVSPWSHSGISAATFTVAMAIWLIIMQWVASGLGGYLTGRLHSKWLNMHTDEVFFRDTAHGFLAWALATVITAIFLASAVSSVMGVGVSAVSTVATGDAGAGYAAAKNSSDDMSNPTTYFVDSLFRSNNMNSPAKDVREEATRILVRGVKNGEITEADKTYLAGLISLRTGITMEEAIMRLDDVISEINTAKDKAKEAVEKVRKATMQAALYTFLSLLIGAFIASASAALGGRHRDEY